MVAVADPFVDQHRGETAGGAEIFKVFRNLGVAVEHFDSAGHFRAHAFHHFLMGHEAVGAQAEHDLHVFVGNAQLVQLVYQHRHKVEAVGHPGGVVADEGHGLARFDEFINGLCADGMVNGIQHPFGNVLHHRSLWHTDLFNYFTFVQGKAFGASSVVKCIFFHICPPLPAESCITVLY